MTGAPRAIAIRNTACLLLESPNEGIEGFGRDQRATAYLENGQIAPTDKCVESCAPNTQKAARFLNAVSELHGGSPDGDVARNYITWKTPYNAPSGSTGLTVAT
jgi:hypothetical protein